jgi:octaprenyl-diphosphate synthase
MEVIRRKTAVLFQGACRVSGILADVSEKKESALAEYGGNLGLAFQMADDLLDYTVDSVKLGKLVGADLREGKLTLPVIYALKQASGSDRWQMVEIVRNRDFSPDEFRWLIERLNKYGGIDYTRKSARQHIEAAKQALGSFEDSADKQLLLDIADYALLRQM